LSSFGHGVRIASVGLSKKSILVVEDDRAIRLALCEILDFEGYTVHQTIDGQKALELLQSGVRPDLILLDLMMPVMNGSQFRDAQLQDPALANIPVIILSADFNIKGASEKLGVARFLKKPVNLDELLLAVSQTF
jgi:CheY-like chemotaxis protein